MLAVDQATRLTDSAAGLICDSAVESGFQFRQSFDGHYSVGVAPEEPAELLQWDAEAMRLIVLGETPPHNANFVSNRKDIDGSMYKCITFDGILDVGKELGLDTNSLMGSFKRVLGRCPNQYAVMQEQEYDLVNGSLRKVGLKLNALPMAMRLVNKYPRIIYGAYSEDAVEKAKGTFLAFSEAVLTPPSEEVMGA